MLRIVSRCIVLSALLIGCSATYHPPTQPASGQAREYPAPFEDVWREIIATFAAKNIPIKTIDKSSGIIASDPLTGTIGVQMDCGYFTGSDMATPIAQIDQNRPVVGTGLGTFNVFVTKPGADITRVQVNSRWSTMYHVRNGYGHVVRQIPMTCSSKGTVESDLLWRIQQGVTR